MEPSFSPQLPIFKFGVRASLTPTTQTISFRNSFQLQRPYHVALKDGAILSSTFSIEVIQLSMEKALNYLKERHFNYWLLMTFTMNEKNEPYTKLLNQHQLQILFWGSLKKKIVNNNN